MNKGIKSSVVVAMMGICIGLSACGEKNIDNNGKSDENISQNSQTVQEIINNDKLSGDYTSLEGYSLRFPKSFLTEKFTIGIISHNGNPNYNYASQYIYTNTYSGRGGDVLVTSLDSCVGSSDEEIKAALSTINAKKYNYKDINITSQKKITINGKEMLKVYGSVLREDGGTTGIVGYYTIIDFKMSGTPEGKQQFYWYGFYENESDKAIMEEYVDAMAESFKQN